MKIRDIKIEKTACLAPMAGVADSALFYGCSQYQYRGNEEQDCKALFRSSSFYNHWCIGSGS